MGLLDRLRGGAGTVRVHVVLKGRIGEGWMDVDRTLKVPEGTTLAGFIEVAEAAGVPLQYAIDNSPHLAHTLMINGDRCPVAENAERAMVEGDRVYLLAPLAGG